jgi:hypothetical protein
MQRDTVSTGLFGQQRSKQWIGIFSPAGLPQGGHVIDVDA